MNKKQLMKITLLLLTGLLATQCILTDRPARNNPLDPNNKVEGTTVLEDPLGPTLIYKTGLENWWKFNGNFIDDGSIGGIAFNAWNGTVASSTTMNLSSAYVIMDRFSANDINSTTQSIGFATNDFLNISSATKFEVNSSIQNITIEFWFNITSLTGIQRFIGLGGCDVRNGITYNGFILEIADTNKLSFSYGNSSDCNSQFVGTNVNIVAGTWYHVFFEQSTIGSSLESVNVYIVPYDNTQTTAFNTPELSISVSSYVISAPIDFNIGDSDIMIDDFRYYNRILTVAEKLQNHVATER